MKLEHTLGVETIYLIYILSLLLLLIVFTFLKIILLATHRKHDICENITSLVYSWPKNKIFIKNNLPMLKKKKKSRLIR